jgi:hypothetical protein
LVFEGVNPNTPMDHAGFVKSGMGYFCSFALQCADIGFRPFPGGYIYEAKAHLVLNLTEEHPIKI